MSIAAKNSMIYISMTFLQSSANFLLIPLYTRYLSPEDYGYVSIVHAINAFLVIFLGMALHSAVVRLYYKYKTDHQRVRTIWGTCVTLTLIVTAAVIPVIVLLRKVLVSVFAPGVPMSHIAIGLVTAASSTLFLLFQKSLQAQQNGVAFAKQNLMFFLLNVVLTVLFVVCFNWRALGMLLAAALTNITFFLVSLAHFLRYSKMGLDKDAIKESLSYSLPLIPHALATRIGASFDRFFLNGSISPTAVGIYTLGSQLSSVLLIIAGAVNQAYSPWFFQKNESGDREMKRPRDIGYFLIDMYIVIGTAVAVLSPEIVKIFASETYVSAWMLIPVQVFAAVFSSVYYVVSNLLFVNETKRLGVVTVIFSFLNVLLNVLLIGHLGVLGAALSGLSTTFGQSIVISVLGRKYFRLKYNLFRIFGPIFVGMIVASLVYFLPQGAIGLSIRILALGIVIVITGVRQRSTLTTVVKSFLFRKVRRGY